MLISWLKYNNLPTFNTPGEPAGGGGPAAPEYPAPSGTVEDGKEVDETSNFVLDAFEVLSQDEPEEEDEAPTEDESVEDVPPAQAQSAERIPAATQDSAASPRAQTPAAPAKPGDATPPEAAAPKETAQQPGSVEPTAVIPPKAEPDEKTLQGFAQALEEQQGVFAKKLGEQRYQLSQEDLDRLNSEPDKFIPELAGRIQVETLKSTMRVLWAQLPQVVNQIVAQSAANTRAENAFWDLNKDLDRGKHAELVKNAGLLFRQSFKDADEVTFNRSVGQMVRGMLGMTALAVQEPAAQSNGHAGPVVKTPGTVVRQVSPGFAPAGGNAAPSSSSPPAKKNPWEALFELHKASEEGLFDT